MLGGYLVFDVPTCLPTTEKEPVQCSGLSLWTDPVPDAYSDDTPVGLFPNELLTPALPKPGAMSWPTPIVLRAHVPTAGTCSMSKVFDCSTGFEPDAIAWQGTAAGDPPDGYVDRVSLSVGPLSLQSGKGWTAGQEASSTWPIRPISALDKDTKPALVLSVISGIDASSSPLAIADLYPDGHGVQFGHGKNTAWIAEAGAGDTGRTALGMVSDGIAYEIDVNWHAAGSDLPKYLAELHTIEQPWMNRDGEGAGVNASSA